MSSIDNLHISKSSEIARKKIFFISENAKGKSKEMSHLSKKDDESNQTSEIFATKMEMREKVLTFLTHKSKPRVVQTMLVLVKVLSCQCHSYPLTQLAGNAKSLCKYYISMICVT